MKKTCGDDMLSIFPRARHESAFFCLNEAFFFIFSYLNFSDSFLPLVLQTLSIFLFLCFPFEDGVAKMWRMKFSFHEIHVNVPDNMNLNSLFFAQISIISL